MEQETKKYYSVDFDLRVEDSIEGDGDWKHLTADDVQISPEHLGSDEVIPYKSWDKYIILLRKGGCVPFILEINKDIPAYIAHFEELDGMEVKTLSVKEYFDMTHPRMGKSFDEEDRAATRRDSIKNFLIQVQQDKFAMIQRFAKQLEEVNPSLCAQMVEKYSVPATKQDFDNELAQDMVHKEELEIRLKEYHDEIRKALNLSDMDEVPWNLLGTTQPIYRDDYDEETAQDSEEYREMWKKAVWIEDTVDDKELRQKLYDMKDCVFKMGVKYREKYWSFETLDRKKGSFSGEEANAFAKILNQEIEKNESYVGKFLKDFLNLLQNITDHYRNTVPQVSEIIEQSMKESNSTSERSTLFPLEKIVPLLKATNADGEKFLEFMKGEGDDGEVLHGFAYTRAQRYAYYIERFDPEFCGFFKKLKEGNSVSVDYLDRAMHFFAEWQENVKRIKVDIKKVRMFHPENIGLAVK